VIEAGGDDCGQIEDLQGCRDWRGDPCAWLLRGGVEDAEMSWMFSVRHYADNERQAMDEKYNMYRDPVAGGEIPEKAQGPPPRWQAGHLYPRSSGIKDARHTTRQSPSRPTT
jgi:hypothetical protein